MSARYTAEAYGVLSLCLYRRPECQAIISAARRVNAWQVAQVSVADEHGVVQDVTSTDTRSASLLDADCAAEIYREFESRVAKRVLPMVRDSWGANFNEQYGTQLIRYRPGGHYVAHTDASDEAEFARRFLTVVCYLNHNFVGGRTGFPSLNYSAIPASGKTIVFPARFVHCAEPVQRGEKWVMITWLCASPPVRWI